MLEQGAGYLRDELGYMPWHTAAAFGSPDVMDFFISHRSVNVQENEEGGLDKAFYHVLPNNTISDKVTSTGMTSLHLAAMMGRTQIVKMIIEADIMDINTADNFGATPLIMAIFYKHVDVADVILESNVDLTVITNLCMTPSGVAAFFLPQICPKIFDRIVNKERDLGGKEKLAHYSRYLTPADLKIFHLATIGLNSKEESVKKMITHPMIADILEWLGGKSGKLHDLSTIIYCGLVLCSTSYLCMLSESNLLKMDRNMDGDLIKFILINLALSHLVLEFLISQACQVNWLLRRLNDCELSISQKLTKIFKQDHHPGLHVEGCCFHNFIENLKEVQDVQVKDLLRRFVYYHGTRVLVVVVSMFFDYPGKEYLLSAMLVIIWLQMAKFIIFYTHCIPECLFVATVCFEKCLLAVLQMFFILMCSWIPFFLVLIKLSIKEGKSTFQLLDHTNSNLLLFTSQDKLSKGQIIIVIVYLANNCNFSRGVF